MPQWLRSNVFYRTKIKTNSGEEWTNTPCVPVHPFDANVISSENQWGKQNLFLDLDREHWYVESSTEGHGHLVINTNLEIHQIKEIIDVLVKYGIIQDGIKRQVDERGCLTLRLPGMRKDVAKDNMSFEELAEIGEEPRGVDQKPDTLYNSGGGFKMTDKMTDKMREFFDNLNITA